MLITLDVRNPFNSTRWDVILDRLDKRLRMVSYLLLIRCHLRDKSLVYNTVDRQPIKKMTEKAAQGSILGSILWMVWYVEILYMDLSQDSYLIGHADGIYGMML